MNTTKRSLTIRDFAKRWFGEMPTKTLFTLTRFQLEEMIAALDAADPHDRLRDTAPEMLAMLIKTSHSIRLSATTMEWLEPDSLWSQIKAVIAKAGAK
jgi:hypothetical protein